MAKNYMADVAKMLGVEIGEEFKIANCPETEKGIFKFTNKELIYREPEEEEWRHYEYLSDLINGELEIVKIPWKPKINDMYFYPSVVFKGAKKARWDEVDVDYTTLALGMCYRTREEAEAHFVEDYKKLTGKELEQ